MISFAEGENTKPTIGSKQEDDCNKNVRESDHKTPVRVEQPQVIHKNLNMSPKLDLKIPNFSNLKAKVGGKSILTRQVEHASNKQSSPRNNGLEKPPKSVPVKDETPPKSTKVTLRKEELAKHPLNSRPIVENFNRRFLKVTPRKDEHGVRSPRIVPKTEKDPEGSPTQKSPRNPVRALSARRAI
jgi:hypothetical protein